MFSSFLSKKLEKICASIWFIGITGIFNISEIVPATVVQVRRDGNNQGVVVTQI
jgi:hypothetical protein